MQLQGMNYQRANGMRGAEGNEGPLGKKGPRGEKPEGKPEKGLESSKIQDTYTPSAQAMSYGAEEIPTAMSYAAEEVPTAMSSAAEDVPAAIEETTPTDSTTATTDTTYTTATELETALLKKYEGMTTYNITIDSSLLNTIKGDATQIAKLEEAITAQISSYESYENDSTWTLVHAEMHITGMDNEGNISQESLQVLGQGSAIDAMFEEKYAADELINSIERMLIEDPTMEGADELRAYADALNEVYNGINSVTGYPNFLNEALLGAEHVTQAMVTENEKLLDDLATAYSNLQTKLGDSTDEDIMSILGDAAEYVTENADGTYTAIASKTPLYSVSFGNIEVSFNSDEAEDAYNAKMDAAASASLFYADGELNADKLDDFKTYMLKSNQNLLNMMVEAGITDKDTSEDTIWDKWLEQLQNPEPEGDDTVKDPDVTVEGDPQTPEDETGTGE